MENLCGGSTVRPRRSLTAVTNDVLNEPQAEDLSTTGKQQRRELAIQTHQTWQSIENNSQTARVADKVVSNILHAHTMHAGSGRSVASFVDVQGLEPVYSPRWSMENSGRDKNSPLSKIQRTGLGAVESRRSLSCDRNVNVAKDMDSGSSASVMRRADNRDSCSSASVMQPAENRSLVVKSLNAASSDVSRNWNNSTQLTESCGSQGSYSEAVESGKRLMAVAGTRSSEVRGFNFGTLSVPPGGINMSTGSGGGVTVFSPPVTNSGRGCLHQDGSSKTPAFPPRRSLDSLGRTSSGVFARTPVLPTGMRVQTLAGLWPTAGRALGEPSPVATVMPQVQTSAVNVGHHPAHQSDPADDAENTVAPHAWKRKRKRRSVFGQRRRKKKSHDASQPNATVAGIAQTPASTDPCAEQVVVVAKPNITNTGVEIGTNSSLAHSKVSVINVNPVSATSLEQSASCGSLGTRSDGMRRALKPIENHHHHQQQQHHVRFSSSDIHKPSSAQRSIYVGSWLDMNAAGSGHEAQPLTTYIKRRPSSADVQKVPSISPRCDIFEFCGDDDETAPDRDRPTLRSFRGPSSRSAQCVRPPAAVSMGHGQFTDSVAVSKLR